MCEVWVGETRRLAGTRLADQDAVGLGESVGEAECVMFGLETRAHGPRGQQATQTGAGPQERHPGWSDKPDVLS